MCKKHGFGNMTPAKEALDHIFNPQNIRKLSLFCNVFSQIIKSMLKKNIKKTDSPENVFWSPCFYGL